MSRSRLARLAALALLALACLGAGPQARPVVEAPAVTVADPGSGGTTGG